MATEDEAREAADGMEVQVEAVDLGSAHFHAHPEVKLSTIMGIKNVGEIINSTEGTLKIPEDQVLVEAPSEVALPPEHNLNGKASSLNGHVDIEEKISNAQPHENNHEEAELDGTSAHQSNGISKEEMTDGLSHIESTTEDRSLLKHEKDEEPRYEQQDSGVTVADDLVQEDTLKTDSSIEQTDDDQHDQNQEPEKTNEDTQPSSIANNADIEEAEASTGLQTLVEPHLDDSGSVPGTIDEKMETEEPANADGVIHPDHKESFPEDTSIAGPTEEVVKVDQQSQQADVMDADAVQEEMLKCEETHVQEEVPKSDAHEPTTNTQEMLNKESAEEIGDPMNEKNEETDPTKKENEETVHQSNMEAPKETKPELETTTRVPPANVQVQNHEPSEEIEDAEPVDTEAEMQQSSVAFEDAIPEDQCNLGVAMDNSTVPEDTVKAVEQTDDGQQDQDLEPEKATEVAAEAPSGVQTPVEPNLDNSDAVPDSIDGITETDGPTKADGVLHPDHKESFPEDAPIAEPTEEVVKVEDQQSQQADAMDADVVQEEVPRSEHAEEPATDAHEVLNEEFTEETDGPLNEKTEETAHQSNMAAPEEITPENDTTAGEPPVNIQVQNQESVEEIEDAEAEMQQSSVAFEDAIPEDQCNLGVAMDNSTVPEDTVKAVEQTDDGQQDQDLEPEKATEVAAEAPSGVQTPVEPNLDNSDAVPDSIDGITETDEPAKADGVLHPDHKESFPEDAPIAEPTEEVVKVEDQQSQQADAMDADVVQEEVPRSEHAEEPATDAHEVLNEEFTEETDGPLNEKTEETAHQSNMAAPEEITPENDTTAGEPPVNIQVQNQESVEEIEDAEAEMQQSSVAFEDAIPEDQCNLGVAMDNSTVPEDTVKAVEQTDDGQQDQDLEPEKATEVAAEAPSGVQTPVEPNLDNSDAVPDSIDGITETDEPAKADGVLHPDHKESFPEDAPIAEPTEEVVKVEEKQSQQADAMDADVVKEQVPKSEHADEPATDAHEVLNEESTEETDGSLNEKTEETAYQSNMAAPEEITPENDTTAGEPPVNIQVQNQESVEEIEDAEAVDTEAEMQQSSVAFEEAIPEDQCNLGTTMDGNTVQEGMLEDIKQTENDQQDQDLGPEKATENTQPSSIPDVEVVAEARSGVQTPAGINLDNSDAIPDTTDGNTETNESAKAEGATATSELKVTETEEEPKDSEATEAQEITEHGHVTPSKELSAEDVLIADEPHNDDIQSTLGQDLVEVKETVFTSEEATVKDSVTVEEPTCDSQEVDNAESTQETKGNTAKNIAEVSDVVIVDEAQTEDIAETHMREVEPEETKDTEPVEPEEASDQRNAVLFNDLTQEDTPESEMQQTGSATETTETEAAPQESSDCVSEEPSPEEHKIESETDCDTQEVSITESLEISGDKDIITEGISGQSSMISAGELAQENDVPESEPTADIQPVQEPEPEDIKNTERVEVKETSHEMKTTISQTPAEEDNPETIDLHESERGLSNTEATEAETPDQSDASQSEEQAPEEIASEPQVLEPETVEEMSDTEAIEPPNVSQDNLISTSGESVPEEIATEDNTTTKPDVDHQQLQDQESTDIKETEADKPEGIASSCTLSTSEQSTSEDNATTIEPRFDTQEENSEPAEVTEGTENVKNSTALAEAAAPEEHVEKDATADTSPVQEPELEETKDAEPAGTEDIMTPRDLPAENKNMETMGTEAVPHESHVESVKELTEDDAEPVLELESDEDTKCTDTMEYPGEPNGSTSDEPTPTEENTTVTEPDFDTQQVQNMTSQEIKNGEDAKTDEFSDLSSFPTPEGADQESNLPRTESPTDVQQVQELGSTEETRDIGSVGIEDHQQVSTFEPVDGEPNVDDQQLHAGVKEKEAMETEEVVWQNNFASHVDATEEGSERRSDPDSYVQPAQQVELSRDSEISQLVKAEETSGQVNAVTIEEIPTEDSVVSEIEPPVDIKQEHEQEPVEEIKGIDANEAKEEFITSQVDALEKPASEGNIASIEPTSNIEQENELEATKEIDGIEAINDGEQAENATLEYPSPTDNETTPEGHPAELNEETIGNETDNVMLVPGLKDEIQTSLELKDGACDLGETVLTTQGSENVTDEDAVQSSGDDILDTSNNIDQFKEEQKDGCEHNSSKMSGAQNEENIIHVQDRDISVELLTKRGTDEEASQALFESDTTEDGEKISDLNRQPDDVALQLQTCEADALSIGRQDEVAQKVDLDQEQNEDEHIQSQKEELQADEQKHDDKAGDFTTEPLVEPEGIKNGNTDRTENTDACEAEETEAIITEILKHEEAPHVYEESTPSSMDMKVDCIKGTEEDADAKHDNKDEEENAEKDDIVAKNSTDKQDETTAEITNEELGPGLASSAQEASDLAPSNDDILENDPAAVTQNFESGEHREDKECTGKVNDDVHTSRAAEKEIADEIHDNKEIRNEDNAIHHDESQTKPEEDVAPKPEDNAKIDDTTTTLGGEIIDGNASIKPREIEEIGENKGLESTSNPFVESSIQNNVEHDLHHKVEDEKLSMAEQNDVDIEAMQEKADESASDINQMKQCQEGINTDDVQQLEIEENSFDKIDETISHEKTETRTTEVTINDNIIDKARGGDGGPSDESLKTFNDTGRDLDVSSVITASKEESMNENMEDHKLVLPAHTAQDENTPEQVLWLENAEREMPSSEKLLPTEPEDKQIPNESNEEELQDENQIPNEKNEEDMQDTEVGDAQKDVEQDLPVSHFLMNLILGKKNADADENSESEAERKEGETTEGDKCVVISKQEENMGSLSTENKVDDDLTFEQEKHDVKCSEETQEMVKGQIDNLKLDTEISTQTDDEFNKNTRDLEIPAYQGTTQDKISGELLSEEAASVSTKMETRDIEIFNLELDDKGVDTVCQENTEVSEKIENESLNSNINDLTNIEASEKDTLGEGQTGLLHDSLPEDKSANAVAEQTPLLTESGMIDAKDFSCDAEAVQNLACEKEDETTESSTMEATSTSHIQLECEEVEKKEEEQHASIDTDKVSEEAVETSNDSPQKSTRSEVTPDEQAPQITEPVTDTEKILAHEKEIYEGSTCMDEKENSNFSIKGVENFQTAFEIQADSPNMQINQDKKDEIADNETAMGPEKLGESEFQEHQETGTEQKSPKASDEGDQQFLVEKETMNKEQMVPGTVESHEQTVSVKSNEEQELVVSKVQECDFNVVSPREASEAEENFVDVTKTEFNTDEDQSPKADAEEKAYNEKIKNIEGTKNFTDEAEVKTEAPRATQKAHKKLSLLSGVGSKVKAVKQQLAKVKKAIVRKPGNTKPDSPKS
ncbi:titin-like isoform X2 [Panicum hallii]|uniref:titin-like isoform X2 n=1 Tax=Panicum hallii TaxID=206008 RepID=UPI000DF4D6F4|nr:titin-like isoform X2 [Panicum hallii]